MARQQMMQRRPMPIGPGRMAPMPMAMSPQGKLISVSDKMGMPGIAGMQGTTQVKYDTLPLDGRTSYEFFNDAQNRPFPFSNCGSNGNKLGVGETMVVQRFTMALVTTDAVTGKITAINPLTKTTAGIIDGELTLITANSQVLIALPIVQALPEFNKDAENQVNCSYEFDTLLTVPSQLEFTFFLRCSGVITANTHLRMTIEGVGSIFSPKQSF